MPGQAVEDTLPAWLCEAQAEIGYVARRDGGREPGRAGNRGPAWLGMKAIMSDRNLPGSKGIRTTRSRNQANSSSKAAITLP